MNDMDLRQLILDELEFEPALNAAHIGVCVDDGIVTLTGHVESFAERLAAQEPAKRIKGVAAVALDIEVRYPEHKKLADDQIARRAVDILNWDVRLPDGALQVTVSDGWVKLTGHVGWHYQKEAAEHAIWKLSGVMGVINLIRIAPRAHVPDIEKRIRQALLRNATLESQQIDMHVDGGKITLTGTVNALSDRKPAEKAAWAAPGVQNVKNERRLA